MLKNSYAILEKSLEIKYSDELMYNFLRCKYLMHCINDDFLNDIRVLVTKTHCKETIALYFAVLFKNALKEEGLLCIQQ